MRISIEKEKLKQKGDNVYTLIAYKSSSSWFQYYNTGTYSMSDFFYKSALSKNEIVDLLIDYLRKKFNYGENGYDIFVLFNGVEIIKKDFGSDFEITHDDEFKQLAETILAEIK